MYYFSFLFLKKIIYYIVSTRVLRLAEILAEENAVPSASQKTLLKKLSQDNKQTSSATAAKL